MSNLPRIMRGCGWLFFILMWIPFTFIFFTIPNGRYTLEELAKFPLMDLLPLGLTLVMAMIAMLLIFGSYLFSWLLQRLVLLTGTAGTAKILNIQPTGMRVNYYYYGLRFTLEVQAFGEAFTANAERLVPMYDMQKYQPGMMVNVKYDPTTKLVVMTA